MTRNRFALPYRMYGKRRGYFAFPVIERDLLLDDFDEWDALSTVVEGAKLGDFDPVTGLLAIFDADDSWVRKGAYIQFMGDAGINALMEQVRALFMTQFPLDYSLFFAEALYHWGRLDAVPPLLDFWRSDPSWEDSVYIAEWMSLLLEEEPGEICERRTELVKSGEETEAFVTAVETRHAELRDAHGPTAFVFRGRLLDVEWIARYGLAVLADSPDDFSPFIRLKFETMTGIDCSSFYVDQRLQPLEAAAVFEQFLRGSSARLTPGQRYFFGHPIP